MRKRRLRHLLREKEVRVELRSRGRLAQAQPHPVEYLGGEEAVSAKGCDSATLKSLGSVDDGGGRVAAEGGGDSGRLAGAARAKEHRRQSAVSRAPDGGAREGGLCPSRTVWGRCAS